MEYFRSLKNLNNQKQSRNDVKYDSLGYDMHKLSKKLKHVSLENTSSDLNDTDNTDKKLYTPIEKGTGL